MSEDNDALKELQIIEAKIEEIKKSNMESQIRIRKITTDLKEFGCDNFDVVDSKLKEIEDVLDEKQVRIQVLIDKLDEVLNV